MLRLVLITALLSMLVVVVANPATAQQSVTAAVTQAVSCIADSSNKHDMRAFGQCFSPTADFVNVIGIWWKGQKAIEKNHAFLYGTIAESDTEGVTTPLRNYALFKTTVLTFTSIDVRPIGPNVAIARATWRVVGDPRSNEARNGLMTLVVVNQNGRWLVEAVHNGEIARTVR